MIGEEFEIFGIEGKIAKLYDDVFFLVRNDSTDGLFISKKIYSHDEDAYKFLYRYVVEITRYVGEVNYEFGIVPMPESLAPNIYSAIAECYGRSEINVEDVATERYCVLFGETCFIGNPSRFIIDSIANIIEPVESLLGFYLDKSINFFGLTGWETLDRYINGKSMSEILDSKKQNGIAD